ncbi:hypothetical protein AV530_013492 [Patagioenas fasciata monilis]|uniref:Uncharacterized protein n=1 Tax=Patagioenas fasciata monilis TaxID=372326 RepID=A0A1V4JPT0_PATFA|nr:hypothetical protein AV530_013492 [Patagioenas fasciata monilis]
MAAAERTTRLLLPPYGGRRVYPPAPTSRGTSHFLSRAGSRKCVAEGGTGCAARLTGPSEHKTLEMFRPGRR